MSAILPEDSGVIRCICEFNHDDNFTIQCERCNAWQHAQCLNIRDDSAIPDNYVCPNCQGIVTGSDRSKARNLQRHFLLNKEKIRRSVPRLPETAGTSDNGEEKPRRGRKKSELRAANPWQPEKSTFTPQFCNIPTTSNMWSSAATKFWQELPSINHIKPVSYRETKNLVSTRVVRHKPSKKWRFGINDGALAVDTNVGANKLVCEVVGEIMLRSEFADLPANQFKRLGCPKRGAVFVPGLPLAVDSRRRGSPSVFLQRSVEPNSRLVTRRDANDNLRVFVVSRRSLKAGEELSLGYLWPPHHPMVATQPDTADIRTIRWLLDVSETECPLKPRIKPSAETDEDWELVTTEQYLNRKPQSLNIADSTELKSPPENFVDDLDNLETPASPPRPVVVPRRRCAAVILASEITTAGKMPEMNAISVVGSDTLVSVSSFVYEPVEPTVPPPPKKRMSLRDYMRKRA